jgi:hypothetical protein
LSPRPPTSSGRAPARGAGVARATCLFPATYVGVAEGARSGAAPASSSPGSVDSSSTRYHRRAETHAHNTHAPPTMVRPEGAAVGVGVAAGFSASTAKRTATSRASSPDAAAASPATGADISDRGAVLASRPRDVSEGATVPCPRASRCASPFGDLLAFKWCEVHHARLEDSWPNFFWRQTCLAFFTPREATRGLSRFRSCLILPRVSFKRVLIIRFRVRGLLRMVVC